MTSQRLPNLLIAGVPKAGTTSLFDYLSQHPDVCASQVKELNYFRVLRDNSGDLAPLAEYQKYFSHCADEKCIMEGSPSYAVGGSPVIRGVRQLLGRPRVIITLRDPARRMWSAYNFQRSKGRLQQLNDIDEFIDACERQREQGTDKTIGNKLIALSAGFYSEYVGDWLEEFGDDLRIVFAEHLFRDPVAVVAQLCRWLEIDDDLAETFDYETRNKTVQVRSTRLGKLAYDSRGVATRLLRRQPAMRAGLRRLYLGLNTAEQQEVLQEHSRQRLANIYRESNARLAMQLQDAGYEELPSWLRP